MKNKLRSLVAFLLAVILLSTATPVYAIDSTTVKEVEELREENVKHFEMTDGTYKAVIYNDAVHRKDADGVWQDIDNTLEAVKENGNTEYKTSDGRIKFSKNIKNGKIVELSENGYKISLSLLSKNLKDSNADVKNHKAKDSVSVFDSKEEQLEKLKKVDNLTKVRYNGIEDGIDIEYRIYSNNLKESIIVNSKKDSYIYSFELKLNKLIAVLNEDGSISLKDEETGESKYTMPAPFMFDNVGELSTDVHYTLTQSGKYKYTLTVTADTEWINNDARKFPVTIDPTIEVDNSYGEAYVSSANPDTNYKKPSDGRLYVSSTQRIFLKFDLSTIPEFASIQSATLITQFYFYSTTGNMSIGAYSVPYSWDEDTITWNNSVASHQSEENSVATLSTNNVVSGMPASESVPMVLPFDITSAVQGWKSGAANNGIALKRISGMTDAIAFKGYNSISHMGPVLEISYQLILNGTFYMRNVESEWYLQNGTSISLLQSFTGRTNQKWQITYLGNGYHKIISSDNGLALTYQSSSGNVTLSNYTGASNQMWRIIQASGRQCKISPMGSSSFITVSNYNVTIGAAQTNNSDEWIISQYIDYVLAYVGDLSTTGLDAIIATDMLDTKQILKTNADAYGYADNSISRQQCSSLIQRTEVFISLSHGFKDCIVLSDGRFSIDYLEEQNITDLSNLKFVFFAACSTGEGGAGADNLVNAMVERGAQNVLGFTIEVGAFETIDWLNEFVDSLSQGNTIGEAMEDADDKISENEEYTNPTTISEYRYFVGDINYIPFD